MILNLINLQDTVIPLNLMSVRDLVFDILINNCKIANLQKVLYLLVQDYHPLSHIKYKRYSQPFFGHYSVWYTNNSHIR